MITGMLETGILFLKKQQTMQAHSYYKSIKKTTFTNPWHHIIAMAKWIESLTNRYKLT